MSKVWLFADYKQAEPRIVAAAGPVPKLLAWFDEEKDVHLEVTKDIARVAQGKGLTLPNGLFTKRWDLLTKADPERNLGKNTVNGNNYGLGERKFSLITGLPVFYAAAVQGIYFELFPEIKSGYQAWIAECMPIIYTPQGWPIHFHSWVSYNEDREEVLRKAYSLYAQSTVGFLITKTLCDVGEHFRNAELAYVGSREIKTPWAIRRWGYDVQLQIHDAVGVSVEERDLLEAKEVISHYGEQELEIRGRKVTLPLDYKTGPNWKDLTDL